MTPTPSVPPTHQATPGGMHAASPVDAGAPTNALTSEDVVIAAGLTRLGPRDDHEADQRPLDFRLIVRLLELTRPYRVMRNWLVVLVLIRSVQLPALTWLLAMVINGPVQQGDVAGVWRGALLFFLLSLSTQLVMHFRQRLAYELGELVVDDLRVAVFAHLQTLTMSFYHRTKVGRIISRLVSDVEDVRVGVQEVLFVTLVQLGQMTIAALFMLWYDVWLFLIVLGMVPVLWLTNRVFHGRLSRQLRAMRDSFSRVTATLAEAVLGIRVTQGFVRQSENARLFGELVADHSRYTARVLRTQGLFLPLLELKGQAFLAVLLLVGGLRLLADEPSITLGELVGFFFMANLFFAPVTVLGNQYNQALTAMAGCERLFQLLDTPPDWVDSPEAVTVADLKGQVEFRQVTFGYQPDRPVLNDISFAVQPGQTVALVGPTGSGKTSIVNLLARFYWPQSGSILLDGREARTIRSASLHQHLGIVLQQNLLFHGSVADNIRFARPTASDAEVAAVCEQLGCHDLFEALPEGLATQVGEHGQRISVGQRQLISVARALLADPRILIFDEATSNIDAHTEERMQRALRILWKGRTTFVVAHRLSTIRQADLVLVLDQGRIVERGNHDQLMMQGKLYARMYEQFVRTV